MNTSRLVCFFLLLAAVNLHAQTNVAAQPSDMAYAIASRDANTRVWQGTNWTQDTSGQWVPQVHRVTELGIGICHKVGSNYVDSSETISLLPDGTAAATNCATAVFFPSDIGSGVIRLVTSDGKVLQNGPAYLAFDDGTNAFMIAAVTNSVGELISSNQVLYPDIFHGAGFRADLLCTVRKSGFESDVVFREQIPGPTSLGFGTNARVELVTEWFDTPEPLQSTNAPDKVDGLRDVTLHFGVATIGPGKVFVTGTTNSTLAGSKAGGDGTPVYKSWIHSKNGTAFLVESVPYRRLAPQLKQLPTRASAAVRVPWHKVFTAQKLPSRPRLEASAKRIQMAKVDANRRAGVVLDYVEISGTLDSYTFSAGTYFVNGPVYCTGNITISANSIFKYPPQGMIMIEGPLTLTTTPVEMAIFTAADDDSVGQSMRGVWPGYTGKIQGTYGDPAIDVAADENHNALFAPNLANMRFTYAYAAISLSDWGYDYLYLANIEIKYCNFCFDFADTINGYYNDGGRSISLSNCLLASFSINDGTDDSWTFGNCTLDGGDVSQLWGGAFYNCVLINVSSGTSCSGSNNGFNGDGYEFGDNQVEDGSGFQTGLLGDHYLTSGSPFVDAGNTTADQLGLYHYTTQTSQVKEANTVVDLGYHYVAVNGSGNPIDTDGDGIPDYLEDANGNGIFDAGDLANWRGTILDTSGVLGLEVYTPLK